MSTTGDGQAESQVVSAVESILLVAVDPVSVDELARALGVRPAVVMQAVEELGVSLRRGIRLEHHADLYRFVTAPENGPAVQRFLGAVRPAPLSRAALETLTIVAYRQPVTRAEIDAVRGVDSDRVLRTLLDRGLVEVRGQREVLGRPSEFGTTAAFLEYFGLQSLGELPPLPDPESASEQAPLGFRG